MRSRILLSGLILTLLAGACATDQSVEGQDFDELLVEYENRAAAEFAERDDDLMECLLREGYDSDRAREAVSGSQSDFGEVPVEQQMTAGLTSQEAIVGVVGYGFAPVAVALLESEAEAPEEPPVADDPIGEALDGCSDQVIGTNYHGTSLTELSELTAQIDARVEVHERVLAAQSAWSGCLAEQGVEGIQTGDQLVAATQVAFEAMSTKFPTQFDIAAAGLGQGSFDNARSVAAGLYGTVSDWNALAEREIEVALLDLACRDLVDLEGVESVVRDEVSRELQPGGS